jgi:agmatine deiminase
MLYFSSLLKERYPEFFSRLSKALIANGSSFKLLENTNDIWCRDYMPVFGASAQAVQFQYAPSYLENYPEKRTDPNTLAKQISSVSVTTSPIKLEGGNVVRYADKAIVTERIYEENPEMLGQLLEDEIARILGLKKIVVIPCEGSESDLTGHADGICRFIDAETVLLNDLSYNETLRKKVLLTLQENGLNTIELLLEHSFYKHAKWPAYINFLLDGDVLYLPVHGIEEDENVIAFFKKTFPRFKVVAIDASEIIEEKGLEGGGALNCISWSNHDYSQLNDSEKFEMLGRMLHRRSEELGRCFTQSARFVRREGNELVIETEAGEHCKEALRHAYSLIKIFVRELYGYETVLRRA